MGTVKRTWYFIEPDSKLADLYNILHLPYTAMALSIVLAGACTSPSLHLDRTAGALSAYFLGLGLGSHALDQLEPHGSHYVGKLRQSELLMIGGTGLCLGAAIGVYFAFTVSLLLIPLVAGGTFFAVAYTLPSKVAGGAFHSNLSFAFSWGFLPYFTSYFVNALGVTAAGLGGSMLAGLAAYGEIRLSRRSRAMRTSGFPSDELTKVDRELKALVAATCAVSVVAVILRLA